MEGETTELETIEDENMEKMNWLRNHVHLCISKTMELEIMEAEILKPWNSKP